MNRPAKSYRAERRNRARQDKPAAWPRAWPLTQQAVAGELRREHADRLAEVAQKAIDAAKP